MATKKALSEFSLKATSFAFSPGPAGSVMVQVNFEGTATGFGTVCGTMNASPAAAPSGTWDWCAASYPEKGESVTGTGKGTFKESGPNRWNTTGLMEISDGRVLRSEGQLDMATRVWKGKIYAAS